MALVGANFPEMKTPAESGEIMNTPVKDLLEQFKAEEGHYGKDICLDETVAVSKHSSTILKDVSKSLFLNRTTYYYL